MLKAGNCNGFYYIFDPLRRDSNGVPTPNDVWVLMKFRTLSQIENYIQYVHLVSQNKVHMWVQIQFIEPQINETAIHTISQAHYSRHERYASILGTPEHERRKKRMKSHPAVTVGTPEYEKHKEKVNHKNTNIELILIH